MGIHHQTNADTLPALSALETLRSEDPVAKRQKRMARGKRHSATKESRRRASPLKMRRGSLTKLKERPCWKKGVNLGGAGKTPI